MSAIPHSGSVAATQQACSDPIILEFVGELCREGVAESYVAQHPGPARHFLTWLARNGTPLGAVDGTAIDSFLRHDCDCPADVPASALLHRWRKRRSSPEVMEFVRFLERTGRMGTPGDLDDNLRILDEFVERLRADGDGRETIKPYRNAGSGLIVSLHLSRIRLCDLNPDVLGQFRSRQLICSIPGVLAAMGRSLPRLPMAWKFAGSCGISLQPAGSIPSNRRPRQGFCPTASRGSAVGSPAIAASAPPARTGMPSCWRRSCPLPGTIPGPMTQRGSDRCCSNTSSGDRAATPGGWHRRCACTLAAAAGAGGAGVLAGRQDGLPAVLRVAGAGLGGVLGAPRRAGGAGAAAGAGGAVAELAAGPGRLPGAVESGGQPRSGSRPTRAGARPAAGQRLGWDTRPPERPAPGRLAMTDSPIPSATLARRPVGLPARAVRVDRPVPLPRTPPTVPLTIRALPQPRMAHSAALQPSGETLRLSLYTRLSS